MNNTNTINGIHHITAISSHPADNVRFYESILGLRLVKQTVNFDDPYTYHLYYGDYNGSPGTILTFFPWAGMVQGTNGAGMVITTGFAIPNQAINFWLERLHQCHIAFQRDKRFGDEVIRFADPHGMQLELIASDYTQDAYVDPASSVAPEYQIIGFHSATTLLRSRGETHDLLTDIMGFVLVDSEDNRYRYQMGTGETIGQYYDLLIDPVAPNGRQGCGSVHHIAFRTASDEQQRLWQQQLSHAGHQTSEVRDRNYFNSIYFHEPGGVLFEIATDPPGFTVDEPLDQLGSSLMLPRQYEPMRQDIEKQLPPLRESSFIHTYVEPSETQFGDLTIVALHGTGGDEHDLLPLARQIAPGAAIISPRGNVTENGMNRFFKRLGPNQFDDREVSARASELAEFITATVARNHRPAEQLTAIGYSNGANIAAALMLVNPQTISQAILLRPMLPLNPTSLPDLSGKHILILRGTLDMVIPQQSTDQLIALLAQAHAQVEVIEIDAGHELTAADIDQAARWLSEVSGTKHYHQEQVKHGHSGILH